MTIGKPEAAAAVDRLLMMGKRMPETCWAVFKRQVINLWSCCNFLVDSVERLMIVVSYVCWPVKNNRTGRWHVSRVASCCTGCWVLWLSLRVDVWCVACATDWAQSESLDVLQMERTGRSLSHLMCCRWNGLGAVYVTWFSTLSRSLELFLGLVTRFRKWNKPGIS